MFQFYYDLYYTDEKDDGMKNDKFAWIGGGGGQISIETMYFIDLTLRLPSVRLALRFRIRWGLATRLMS